VQEWTLRCDCQELKDKSMDLETIAAYIDGTLTPDRMAEVAAQLANSPDDYQVFADAVALRDELSRPAGAATTVAAAPALTVRSRRPRRWVFVGAASAAAAAVLLVTQIMETGTGPPLFLTAEELNLRGSGSLTSRFGEEWTEPPWPQVRSPAVTSLNANESFRAGALSYAVMLAADAGDLSALREASDHLGNALTLAAAGPTTARIREIATQVPPTNLEGAITPFVTSLRELYDVHWFDLGLWAEQARLASIAREHEFFDGDIVRRGRALRDGIAGIDSSALALPLLDRLLNDVEAAPPGFDAANFRAVVDSLFGAAG
jgi:hypothetical protein